jgi:hypothetical protein
MTLYCIGYCTAVLNKIGSKDWSAENSLYFPDIVGHALIRCFEYIQYEYPPDYDFTNSKIPGPDKNKGTSNSSDHTSNNNGDNNHINRKDKKQQSNVPILPRRPANLLHLNHTSSICAFYVVDSTPNLTSPAAASPAAASVINPNHHNNNTRLVSVARPTEEFANFLNNAASNTLCELASASFYLDIKPLVELCCKAIANCIKGKSPEQIRSTFNIVNDFTPAEEEQVRQSVLERTMLLPASVLEEDPNDPNTQTAQAALQRKNDINFMQAYLNLNNPAFQARTKLLKKLQDKKQKELASKAVTGINKNDSRNIEDLMNFIEQKYISNTNNSAKYIKQNKTKAIAAINPPVNSTPAAELTWPESKKPNKKKKKKGKNESSGNGSSVILTADEEVERLREVLSAASLPSPLTPPINRSALSHITIVTPSIDNDNNESDLPQLQSIIQQKISGLNNWEEHNQQEDRDNDPINYANEHSNISAYSVFLCDCSAEDKLKSQNNSARPLPAAPDLSSCPYAAILLTLPRCSVCGLYESNNELDFEALEDMPPLDTDIPPNNSNNHQDNSPGLSLNSLSAQVAEKSVLLSNSSCANCFSLSSRVRELEQFQARYNNLDAMIKRLINLENSMESQYNSLVEERSQRLVVENELKQIITQQSAEINNLSIALSHYKHSQAQQQQHYHLDSLKRLTENNEKITDLHKRMQIIEHE